MKAWFALLLFGASLPLLQQSTPILPDETAGLDRIVQTLVSAFDHVDIVALGDNHWNKMDSDLRIALVRSPDFARKVRVIVVEFGSTAQQPTLDRYIRGEDVPLAELQQVWRTTSQTGGTWDSPLYAEFYAAVRDVNRTLAPGAQIRVLAGDPPAGTGLGRDATAYSVLEEHVLRAHGKALVIYGSGHLLRAVPDPVARLTKLLDTGYPGSTLVVITAGGPHPESQQFESGLKTQTRPVLVPLGRPPFRDMAAGAFRVLGLTQGQIADACVYFGVAPEVWVGPPRQEPLYNPAGKA
jgi:uncharacterized iron-regulated protein